MLKMTKTLIAAVAALALGGASAQAGMAGTLEDTYTDYDGGLAPIRGEPAYVDRWNALRLHAAGASDTYADYDGGLAPLTGYAFAAATGPYVDGWLLRANEEAYRSARLRGTGTSDPVALLVTIALERNLNEWEVAGAEDAVTGYCAGGGGMIAMEAVLEDAAARGCRGECLARVAECMERGVLDRHVPEDVAGELVLGAVTDVCSACDRGETLLSFREQGDWVAAEFEERLSAYWPPMM